MPAFHTVAVPHADILAGRLTMDVFAADLWEVAQGRGPAEYRDPGQFFQKTYETEGLTTLLEVVHRRLAGQGGDPVLQIQTPFGGGKTHALIAMYHRAAEWGTLPAVRRSLTFTFSVPRGKVSGLMGVMNLLQQRFNQMDITIAVADGQISEQDYEDKIREAFRQIGIPVEERE